MHKLKRLNENKNADRLSQLGLLQKHYICILQNEDDWDQTTMLFVIADNANSALEKAIETLDDEEVDYLTFSEAFEIPSFSSNEWIK